MSLADKIDQPRLAFENLLQRLSGGRRGRDIGEHFRGLIEKNHFTLGIESDDAVIKIGEYLFPRDLGGRWPFG